MCEVWSEKNTKKEFSLMIKCTFLIEELKHYHIVINNILDGGIKIDVKVCFDLKNCNLFWILGLFRTAI